MKSPLTTEQIKNYLLTVKPIGIGQSGAVQVKDIDPKPWSGHFNYLVSDGDKKAVLRLKGPEWGEQSQGIIDEYKNLQATKDFKVAPRPLWLDKETIFGEAVLLEEYLDGTIYSKLTLEQQRGVWPEIVKLIVRINSIPASGLELPFRHEMISYLSHKEVWEKRLGVIASCEQCRQWHRKIIAILPQLKELLKKFQPRLERVLKETGPVFIFESAHGGHCIITPDGPRFLNWENVSRGDPSYTLAIFLASHISEPYFQDMREELVTAYLKDRSVPEFKELVKQRLAEREISNMIWGLWAYVERKDTSPVEEASGVKERYERVLRILDQRA